MSRAAHGADAPIPAGDEVAHPHSTPAPDGSRLTRPRPGRPPTVLFSCSLSGTVLAAGAALSELSGRPLPEVPGASARALVHRSSHAKLEEILQAVHDGTGSGPATLRLRHADGSPVRVRVTWSMCCAHGSGSRTAAIAIARPMTSMPQGRCRKATGRSQTRRHRRGTLWLHWCCCGFPH